MICGLTAQERKHGCVKMIIGVGIDIINVARFDGMTERFMTRVFTSNERAYLLGKSYKSAAGLFAAKEAVAKALGTGFTGFWPNQVEVMHDSLGKPYVILHGEAARVARRMARGKRRFFREYKINLSISHTDTDAVAFAIISVKS